MFNLFELNMNNIISGENPILRQKAEKVNFPLSDANKSMIKKMTNFLIQSNDEKIATEKNLVPSIGIAAPQIGNSICLFCILNIEDDSLEVIINPEIVKSSKKEIFLGAGEGCLSVIKKVEGYVYRSSQIDVTYFNIKGEKITTTYNDMEAIIFQHENDHLLGKLYLDYINPKDPFYKKENTQEI